MNVLLVFLSLSVLAQVFVPNSPQSLQPQVQIDTVHFDHGSTLAVLIGIVKPDRLEARNQYFQSIFPIATKYQYNLGVAFNVQSPTRGNYHPGFVAIASWPTSDSRKQFLQDPKVPDNLADQRRHIWSRFDQIFYKDISEPVNFEVRSDKIYVFTNFWVEDQRLFNPYLKRFTVEMSNQGGEFLVLLQNGESPKDHMYEPDVLMISEWDNHASFKQYLNKINTQIPNDGIRNTNEFVTSYVFGFGS